MNKVGFDNQKYIELQSKHIEERIKSFNNKLYLEFGGKLFDDLHASRVLPGFEPDAKIKMLAKIKDIAEVVVAICASDIEKSKMRGDLGITYDMDVLRLIDAFRSQGLFVGSVVITQYTGSPSVIAFKEKLENLNIKVFLHYVIESYPSDVKLIVSENGFGKNDYVTTQRPLVVITAPGPGSGKMAVCLSQLYHDYKRGIKSGYAKFETFPIWNLPLKHPVNLAYEAATADLNDINMIDPFHLEAYNQTTVNYNRDIEIFPVLNTILTKICGENPYKSPTDMGVNMAGFCIIDDEETKKAAKEEIIRRYFNYLCLARQGTKLDTAITKIESIMHSLSLAVTDRPVCDVALNKAKETALPAVAIELPDKTIVTGKTSDLLGACSAALLNALKALAGLDHDLKILPQEIIEPIQKLKTHNLGNRNPRLHTDEVLIALSITSSYNEDAKRAISQLHNLKNCQAHSSVMLSQIDEHTLKKLGIYLTCEPQYQTSRLYHK